MYDGASQNQKSTLWYNQKLNLNYPFEFEAYIYLGNTNAAFYGIGDGISFVLQRDPAYELAIGGRGGGIGVYPYERDSVSMIYNAVTVEMDTYVNNGDNQGISLGYDLQLLSDPWNLDLDLSWPHIGMASTATSGSLWTSRDGEAPINYVIDNFEHYGVTSVGDTSEQSSWFNHWIKLNIKWSPDGAPGDYANIETGDLSYTWGPIYNNDLSVVDYSYSTKTWPDINIDDYFNSEPFTGAVDWEIPWSAENRLVTWGFTGSNYLAGNPFGVMITKLPNEPQIDVDRKVKNLSVSTEDYASYTQAKPGDILEYKVRVENNSDDGTTIPIRNTTISEDLQTNTWNNQFSFDSNLASFSTPTPSMDGTNFTFNDAANIIEPGNWFEYTYQVVVGEDTTEFINDVTISSTYSTTNTFGETNVTVYPADISIEKSVSDDNPKVGDTVDVTLDLTQKTGLSLLNQVTDAIPAGYELVSNSTVISILDNAGVQTLSQVISDGDVWTGSVTAGYQLDVDTSVLTISNTNVAGYLELLGGSVANNSIQVTYKIKPTDSIKGKLDLALGTSAMNSKNKADSQVGLLDYSANSADVLTNIKTEIIISFHDPYDALLSSTSIRSSNADFNGSNPVTLYYNTNDTYDYTTIINEISANLLADSSLSLSKVEGDVVSISDFSGTIKEAGNTIDVYYTSDATITVEFYNESDVIMPGYTVTIGAQINDNVDLLANAAVTGRLQELIDAGYEITTRPTNERNVVVDTAAVTVKYKITGQLFLESAPSMVDFGLIDYDASTKQINDPVTTGDLVVNDLRATTTDGWTLQAAVTTDMTNGATILADALIYIMEDGTKVDLNSGNQNVFVNATNGRTNITSGWGATEEQPGLKMVYNPASISGTGSKVGTFTGTVTWTVIAGQP
ncbi:hypothetical protein ACYSNU_09235 [Enterococcus sp. LJL120]